MEVVVQMTNQHLKNGISVEIVTFDETEATHLANRYIEVHGLGKGLTHYQYNRRLVPWLNSNIDRFDAVVIHGLWQYHSFGAWQVLSRLNIPYFVYTHGMLDPWFKRTFPLKHIKKWLFWPWADYRVLRDARAVLFTCEEERLLARESFWLYQCNEVVSPIGTSAPPTNSQDHIEAFLKRHPMLRNRRLLLFLSRIHEKKGCDLLISAFAKVAHLSEDLHLVIAGPDQTGWVSDLKLQAVQLGVADRITWPGMLQGDEKWGAYYAAEAFCLPSHQENFGIVVAEALGCARPVLISNKVNIWREISKDAAGIVNDDTLEGTVAGLLTWLNMSVEDRLTMETAARRCFDKRFRIEEVADRLIRKISEYVEAPVGSTAMASGESS